MNDLMIGVQVAERSVPAAIDAVVRAEELGLDAVWMTVGGVQPDSVAVLAAAAMRTQRIKLGTSIVPIYPRHPFALAQEAKVVAELAPGRFRLGVGPSHKAPVEETWGIPFRKPLGHLREYLEILKASLQQGGQVEFEGQFFRVRADWGPPCDIHVMASALRRRSFELAGELADGAISWVCPLTYLEQEALPALSTGAARTGRPTPPLVMHAAVCVHADADEVHEAAAKRFTTQPRLPFYRRMFADAGFPEASAGTMSRAMLDSIVISGDEESISRRLRTIAATGVSELLCTILPVTRDAKRSAERTLQLLAELSRAE
jgi:F420-dependent oxidoreductase-like protein